MPHSGAIVRAHRHRRIVERRQKIGPNIIDFCGGLLHGFYDVLDVLTVQLQETPLDHLNG